MLLNKYFKRDLHPLTVTLVGVGGTGSRVLTELGAMHSALKQLEKKGLFVVAFDDDNIDKVNFGRSKFNHSEVGANKAAELVTRSNRFYQTEWVGIPGKVEIIESFNPFQQNIFITCVDSVRARREIKAEIYDELYRGEDQLKQFVWIDCGNDNDFGQVIVTKLDAKNCDSKDYFDYFPDAEDNENTPSCSMAEALIKQDLYVNAFAATIAVNQLWKLINGKEVANITRFNLTKNLMK